MKALFWMTCFFAALAGLVNLAGGVVEVVLYKYSAKKEDLCGGIADILMGTMILVYVALTITK